MIKIISGVYGYREGNKIVPKTPANEPFSLDKAKEAQLVKRGIAEYVSTVETLVYPDVQDGGVEYDEFTKFDELKAIASRYGLDASKCRSKADVIAIIEQKKNENQNKKPDNQGDVNNNSEDGSGGDDNKPPMLTPINPV